MTRLLVVLLAVASIGRADHLLGPVEQQRGEHVGEERPLSWTIEYFDEWGRTVVDATGGHFYHDRCCQGYLTHDPSWTYPAEVWGTYPMYYTGTTMRYRITLTNETRRTYRNLRVVAIQEYFGEDADAWGVRMGHDAARDWFVDALRGGETVVLEGRFAIPWDGEPGLDQTHLQVQHWDQGRGQPGPGSVIIDDVRAAIWCPPELQAEALLLTSGQAHMVAATVDARSGSQAVLMLRPTGSGEAVFEILDSSGAKVATLPALPVLENQPYEVSWDGTDDSGRSVVSGVYLIRVSAPGVDRVLKAVVVR